MRDDHERTSARRATARWWRIAAGIALPVATALLCAAVLVLFIAPIPPFVVVALAELAFVAAGTVWLVLAVIHAWRYRWDKRILAAPAIVAVTAALLVTGVPFHLGWMFAQEPMTDAARRCAAGTDDRWISVYHVDGVSEGDGGCYFVLAGGYFNTVGMAYLPSGAPTADPTRNAGDYEYKPIGDDWYTFVHIVS